MPEETKQEQSNLTLLEEARQITKDLKAAIEARKALLEREEALKANEMLGGKSNAGQPTPELSPEEKVKAEAMKLLAGTGLNPFK
jgi:hypothetical protein